MVRFLTFFFWLPTFQVWTNNSDYWNSLAPAFQILFYCFGVVGEGNFCFESLSFCLAFRKPSGKSIYIYGKNVGLKIRSDSVQTQEIYQYTSLSFMSKTNWTSLFPGLPHIIGVLVYFFFNLKIVKARITKPFTAILSLWVCVYPQRSL